MKLNFFVHLINNSPYFQGGNSDQPYLTKKRRELQTIFFHIGYCSIYDTSYTSDGKW